MILKNLLGRPLVAATAFALAAGFTAVPVSIEFAAAGLSVKEAKAFARRGADDPAGHVRGGGKGKGKDDPAGDDRGGKGRGRDDGPNHR